MSHNKNHASEHSNGADDPIDPANLGPNGVVEKTAGGDVSLHATQHENGGSDEMSVAGLSGELADPQPVKQHDLGGADHGADLLANLNSKISDGTVRDIGVGLLSARPAAGTAGRFYWATDNDLLYYDNGVSWDTINAEPEAHALGGAEHTSDTLANLNAKVSDATLDDSSDPRDPNDHAGTHENGGGDEISVAGLSGALADPQTPTSHASSHQNGGADEISVAGLSGVLADAQTPASHALGGSAHSADSLANLNSKISDATLDDSGDPRDPNAHSASHENGGSDEIDVGGLSGELADPQPPKTHASTHSDGGSDEISVENLATSETDTTKRLAPDGAGGVQWDPGAHKQTLVIDGYAHLIGGNQSGYYTINNADATITAIEQYGTIQIHACTVKAIRGNCQTFGSGMTLTLRKNGVNTAITGTVSGTGDFEFTGSVAFADGDDLSIAFSTPSGGVEGINGLTLILEVA